MAPQARTIRVGKYPPQAVAVLGNRPLRAPEGLGQQQVARLIIRWRERLGRDQ